MPVIDSLHDVHRCTRSIMTLIKIQVTGRWTNLDRWLDDLNRIEAGQAVIINMYRHIWSRRSDDYRNRAPQARAWTWFGVWQLYTARCVAPNRTITTRYILLRSFADCCRGHGRLNHLFWLFTRDIDLWFRENGLTINSCECLPPPWTPVAAKKL